jgi:hypothetical protein
MKISRKEQLEQMEYERDVELAELAELADDEYLPTLGISEDDLDDICEPDDKRAGGTCTM